MNHIQNAYQSLRSNRIRSGLTMLGVTIGIASITAILALSGGASKIVDEQINSLGGNIAIIKPGAPKSLMTNITQPQPNLDYAASTLKESDVAILKTMPSITAAAPLMKLNGTIKTKSASIENSTILATTPDLINVSKLVLRDGQFLDNTISEDTAVIGKQLAIDIFGTELAIGKTFSIKNHDFIVIGVLKNDNNPVNYNSIDFNNTAIINMSAGKKLNQNIAQIQQINFRSNNAETLSEQIDAVNKLIKSNHQNEADFSILTGGQISKPTSQLFYTIAGVTTAIAAISLVVGGIGIMNIMLVTVAERTHEIGIRKAIGASNIDISWQFLMESLAISIVGGIAGYLLGYVTAFTISSQMAFTPAFNLEIALTSLSVSILMGLIFGLYPALRAARKDPIEALNHRI